MARLDRSRPYAESWGNGIVLFEQDYKRFNRAGFEIDDDGNAIIDDEPEPVPTPVPEQPRRGGRPRKAAVPDTDTSALPPTEDEEDGDDYDKMSDEQLREMLELIDESWTDRATALKALRDA